MINELQKKQEWNQKRIEELEAEEKLSKKVDSKLGIKKEQKLEKRIRRTMEIEILRAHNVAIQRSLNRMPELQKLEDTKDINETNQELIQQYEALDIAVKQNVLAEKFINERNAFSKVVEVIVKDIFGGVCGIMIWAGIGMLFPQYTASFMQPVHGMELFLIGAIITNIATAIETKIYSRVFQKLNAELGKNALFDQQKDKDLQENLQNQIQKTADIQVQLQAQKYLLEIKGKTNNNENQQMRTSLEDTLSYDSEMQEEHKHVKNFSIGK